MLLVRWLKACSTWNNVASYTVIWQLAIFLSMINELFSRLETLVSPEDSTLSLELTTLVSYEAAAALHLSDNYPINN